MIQKNIVKQPKCLVEVTISAPWADIEAQWNQTLQKLAADVEIPGFRKGQVPPTMVETNLGSKLQDEFFKIVYPTLLIQALQGSDIVPIDYPKYQLTSFIKGGQLSFRATITQRPEVKMGEYKTIKSVRPPVKVVSDEDVEKVIGDLFKRWKARGQPSSPINGSASSNQTTGSLSFNQPQNATPASGQTSSGVPDDNFARAMEAQNLADLKTKIKTDLEKEAKFNNELDFEEAILQEVEKMTTVEIPDILVEDELNRMLVSLQRRVSDMGLLIDEYLKSQNTTLEEIKTKWRTQAEKNVRMELGLAEIARLEKVEITDAEVQAEIDKIQDARLKAQFAAQEPRLHLRHSLRQMRTLDLLKTLVKTP